jgi:hypothetical protein
LILGSGRSYWLLFCFWAFEEKNGKARFDDLTIPEDDGA